MSERETQPRRQPTPGAGVVVFRGEDVLLIKRGRPPYEGQWSIPGGKVEYGETAAEAALRELGEETGVEAEIVGLIDVVDSIGKREPGQPGDWHYLLVDFAARWTGGEPVPADDASAAEFLPFEEAVKRTRWDRTRQVLHRARDIIQALPAPHSKA
ncbi:NUDIX hydrolase [Maricaulis sp. CAU 1757]